MESLVHQKMCLSYLWISPLWIHVRHEPFPPPRSRCLFRNNHPDLACLIPLPVCLGGIWKILTSFPQKSLLFPACLAVDVLIFGWLKWGNVPLLFILTRYGWVFKSLSTQFLHAYSEINSWLFFHSDSGLLVFCTRLYIEAHYLFQETEFWSSRTVDGIHLEIIGWNPVEQLYEWYNF